MIILKPVPHPQLITIVPRELLATSMEVTDESSGETVTESISTFIDRYFLKFNQIFELKEGGKYTLRVLNGTEEVYLGSIFCTAQETGNYSINDGVYKETETENKFLIVD
jgi:hypothetical protein